MSNKKTPSSRFSLLVLVSFLSGCAGGVGAALPKTRAPISPYDDALEANTRAAISYHGFDRELTAVVTLLSPEFEEALAKELSRLGRQDLRDPLGLQATPEGAKELLVFIDARDPAWEKLMDVAPVFALQSQRSQAAPGSGDGLGRGPTATILRAFDVGDSTLRHLFPHINTFGRFFRARLPQGDSAQTISISGAPATLRLNF